MKKVAIFNLRQEYLFSGEASSHLFLKNLLQNTDIELINGIYIENSQQGRGIPLLNFKAIKNWQNYFHDVGTIIVKVPTPALIFFASKIFRKFYGRLIFWIDSQNWHSLPIRITLQLLQNEPVLTTMRLFLNRNVWFKLSQKRATVIVVSSQTQKKKLFPLAHPQSSIHVIPNGTMLEQDAMAYKEERLKKEKFVIGYIGHARMVKGLPDLLWVLKHLKKNGYSFETQLAFSEKGKGKLIKPFEKAGFPTKGLVNRAEFYNSLDFLILPYWTDSSTVVFPNVLLESLSFGVPVITTKHDIFLELFEQENQACLVNPYDRTELFLKVADILDGKLKLPSSASLQQHFKNHFSRSIITKKWLDLLLSS